MAAHAFFALLLLLQIPFPSPGGSSGRRPVPNQAEQAWIHGQVLTQGGQPVPLATVAVRPRPDASRADQPGSGVGWPGVVTRVRTDGSFRVAVPGGTTVEVCATVPAQGRQCQTVDVNIADLQTVIFSF